METVEIDNPPPADALVNAFGRQRGAFVLESTQSRYGLGEWSFFGAEPFDEIRDVSLSDARKWMEPYRLPGHRWIPFCGGAVGYLAYDYGRRLERLPEVALDDRSIADLHFRLYDGVAALHHPSGRLFLAGCGLSASPDEMIAKMRSWLDKRPSVFEADIWLGEWEWNMSRQEFISAVERVREYIADGDIYQVNLSQRARCSFSGDPVALYQSLRRGNPAPYSAYLAGDDMSLISTSPEQFLRKRGRDLETRPIKGTAPRSDNELANRESEAKLRGSEKERAELLMIVDLERNDFGRVAEFGSVRVEGLYTLEHYASVIHQTAQVKASLAAGLDIFDVLEHTFPGGSITGAPKVRSMEIIEELEPTRRGAYCGSIGYLGFDGDAEFNIAIRSLHLKDGWLDYQVGSGIVWDSDPEGEYQETLDKARAIRETLDLICQR